jgi:arabinofuranosyltransferase
MGNATNGTSAATRITALMVVAALTHGLLHAGGTIDDAYISFRYAANLARGVGLVFNVGERVEGFSNPLWTILAAGCLRLGGDPVVVLPLVALACFVALVPLLRVSGRTLAPDQDHAGLGAAGLVAASMSMAFYASSGLETVPYALCLTAALTALLRKQARAFVGLTLLAWTLRPEAALLGLCGLLWFAWDEAPPRRQALRIALGFAALGLPLLAARYGYFHDVVPNTARAKPPSLALGIAYLRSAWPLLPVVALGCIGAWRGGTLHRRLLALWFLHVAAVVAAGGDWMPAHRMFLPTLPWLALCADKALVESLVSFRGRPGIPRAVAGLCIACTLGWVGLNARDTHAATALIETRRTVDGLRTHTLLRLRDRGARRMGLYDIGLSGYVALDVTITDLGGLTDRRIAAMPGHMGQKAVPPEYAAERDPEVFFFTSPMPSREVARSVPVPVAPRFGGERSLWESPWFQREYRHLCTLDLLGFQLLHAFVRKDDHRFDDVPDNVCRRPPLWPDLLRP